MRPIATLGTYPGMNDYGGWPPVWQRTVNPQPVEARHYLIAAIVTTTRQ